MLSSKFVNKVLDRIEKLDERSLKDFILSLSQDRSFFETIFESMIEGIVVLSDEHNIQYINKQAMIILNMVENSLIEKNFFKKLSDRFPKKLFEELLERNQKIIGHEITLRFPVLKIVQLSIYPLVRDGKVLGNVLVFLDITSQKEERLKLHHAESLAALTTLAAGVAHEIKNPLGSLDIHVQLLDRLTDKCDFKIQKEFKELLNVVMEEISRLNNIVKDFLFTVRPIHIQLKNVNIFKVMQQIIKLLQPAFDKKGVKLTLDGDNSISKVPLDSRYLNHAIINVLKNSLEATKRNGRVSIDIQKSDEDLVIQITDSGRGITDENMGKIFEPYFTTKDFGTGLGLTIVYKIIKEHNGTIQIDSQEGKGTTFKMMIPCFASCKRLLSYNNGNNNH